MGLSGSKPQSNKNMKAILQTGYGSPTEVLHLCEVPQPLPTSQQVLVRVCSSTVNTPDWAMTLGLPYLLRLAFGLSPRRKPTGTDVAGIVDQVGSDVTQWKVGDRVVGASGDMTRGAFAEYVCLPAEALAKIPDNVSMPQAAACVMSGATAYGVADATNATNESRILVNGASGSVGTLLLPLLKAKGAHVTAVCSGRNTELVKSLGADATIDYTQQDYTELDDKYDVIVDHVLNHSYKESGKVLKENGFVIPNSIGADKSKWFGAIPMFFFKPSHYPAVSCDSSPKVFEPLLELISDRKLPVTVDRQYSLEQVPQAVAYMASHRARGQVVIQISQE